MAPSPFLKEGCSNRAEGTETPGRRDEKNKTHIFQEEGQYAN